MCRRMRNWRLGCGTVAIGTLAALPALAAHIVQVGPAPYDEVMRDVAQVLRRAFPDARVIAVRNVHVHISGAHTVDPRLLVCGDLKAEGARANIPDWRLFRVETPQDTIELARAAGQGGEARFIELSCGAPQITASADETRRLQRTLDAQRNGSAR